jgi:hypothetical protein
MGETPTSQNAGEAPDVGAQPSPPERNGTPRWVKVFALLGIVLVALVIVMLFTGHGPARHTGGTSHAAGPAAELDGPHDRLESGS